MLRVALIGNPNVGKSSFFNSLTGETQKVANWPGKTIECKRGVCKVGLEEMELFDLPGTYSLSPFSEDEKVVQDTLDSVRFDAILQIADSSNLERNLYLTLELLEKTRKVVVALNMDDVAAREGLRINEKKLSDIFGVDFVKIDARNPKSLGALLVKIAEAAEKPAEKPGRVHTDVKYRYQLIREAVGEAVTVRRELDGEWFDRIALHPFAGPVLFFAIMFAVFHLTFYFSEPLSSLVDLVWGAPMGLFVSWIQSLDFFPSWFLSLINDGIISGVGSVVSFFPQIAVMIFLLYFLEDSGYLARVVVVLDGLLKRFGLGGKALIPLLLGFGCSIPAVMAARIVRDKRTRLIATLSTPFMSCSARLPVYVLFTGVFFPDNAANVIFLMYLLGFLVAVASALVFKSMLKKEDEELLIELPRYHWPYPRNLYIETKNGVVGFAKRAGTVIFAASVAVWFLSSAPYGVEYGSKDSAAGMIGSAIAPLFYPLGFSSWQSGLALFNGMVAKEIVVSSMATTYGLGDEAQLSHAIAKDFSAASALSFITFVLLYIPCFAAMGTIKGETGSWKITLLAAAYYLAVAYAAAFIVFTLASGLGVH